MEERSTWFQWTAVVAMMSLLALSGCYGLDGWGLRKTSSPEASYRLVGFWAEVGGQRFDEPHGIAIDPRNGHVLVSDTNNQRIVVLDKSGNLIRQFGEEGEGPGQFNHPMDVAVGPDGSVYVSDFLQDRIQKFTDTGKFLLEWAGAGEEGGGFNAPTGLAVDRTGNVYVADFFNHNIKVFTGNGRFLRHVGKAGHWGLGKLDYPTDVDVHSDGTLLVADAYNYQVQTFTSNGQPQSAWGWQLFWLVPRPNNEHRGFKVPTGAVFSSDEKVIHVADSGNHRVVMLDSKGAFITDWFLPDVDVQIYTPVSIAVSPDGKTAYAADIVNGRIIVLSIEQDENHK